MDVSTRVYAHIHLCTTVHTRVYTSIHVRMHVCMYAELPARVVSTHLPRVPPARAGRAGEGEGGGAD